MRGHRHDEREERFLGLLRRNRARIERICRSWTDAAVAYVVVRLLAARRGHGGAAAAAQPLVDRLRREIAKLEAQIDLLRTVRSWYVLPLAAGATVWLATLVPAIGLPPGATPAALLAAVAVSGLVFGFVGWVVVRLNRRAVEADLLPYRRELEALLAEAEA